MSAGSIVAGNMYWNKKKAGFFQKLYSRTSFSLMDGEGKIFETKNLPKDRPSLLIFTPDAIPVAAVKSFRQLLREIKKSRGSEVNLVVVSRTHEDIVRNFLHAAQFEGTILFDPSGVLGRFLGAWPNMQSVDDWSLSLVNNELKAKWTVVKKEVPNYKELEKKF